MSDSNRYEELKSKIKESKYFSLTGVERDEYKLLKVQFGGAEDAAEPVEPVGVVDDDRISKLEEAVKRLSVENSNLREESAKQQEGWVDYVPPADRNKTATIKIYRKDAESPAGVVVKAVIFKENDFNEETRKYDKLVFNITVRYDDGQQEILKIDAMEFSKIREIERVEIVKEEKRTLRKVEDYVVRPDVDRDGYPKRILGGGPGYGQSIGKGQIPLEVFMIKSTVTIKRKNGQEVQMESDFLNM